MLLEIFLMFLTLGLRHVYWEVEPEPRCVAEDCTLVNKCIKLLPPQEDEHDD